MTPDYSGAILHTGSCDYVCDTNYPQKGTQGSVSWRIEGITYHNKNFAFAEHEFNPLTLELDIYSSAHHLCKMLIFYEPRSITLGSTRHFVEE